MKLKKIINLFGGPSIGKSTIAAGLFYAMKQENYNVEYVTEYAKDLTYEKRFNILDQDQLYIFAKQHRKILRLVNEVDFIITDSPLLLSIIYLKINPSSIYDFDDLKNLVFNTNQKYNQLNIFLKRNLYLNYENEGRTQNLEEAIEVDSLIETVLKELNIKTQNLRSDDETIDKIMNIIEELV